uniref:Uncharacterized protein n=1 Tax=Ciona intestinalis TaxID=7719 RepID=H2XQL5_CIOIN
MVTLNLKKVGAYGWTKSKIYNNKCDLALIEYMNIIDP